MLPEWRSTRGVDQHEGIDQQRITAANERYARVSAFGTRKRTTPRSAFAARAPTSTSSSFSFLRVREGRTRDVGYDVVASADMLRSRCNERVDQEAHWMKGDECGVWLGYRERTIESHLVPSAVGLCILLGLDLIVGETRVSSPLGL